VHIQTIKAGSWPPLALYFNNRSVYGKYLYTGETAKSQDIPNCQVCVSLHP